MFPTWYIQQFRPSPVYSLVGYVFRRYLIAHHPVPIYVIRSRFCSGEQSVSRITNQGSNITTTSPESLPSTHTSAPTLLRFISLILLASRIVIMDVVRRGQGEDCCFSLYDDFSWSWFMFLFMHHFWLVLGWRLRIAINILHSGTKSYGS